MLQLARNAWLSWSTNSNAHSDYNRALLALLRTWPTHHEGAFAPRDISEDNHRIRIGVEWVAPDFSRDYFDQVLITDALQFKGFRHYQPTGWGQPLIGIATNRGLLPEESYFPPEGIVRPLTAFLDFSSETNGSGSPTLKIFQPDRQPVAEICGKPVDLAADLSAAYGVLLSRTKLKGAGLRAFLNRKALGREAGIFLLEPFHPDKIPVLMIHGLASSPLAWEELTDALWANPELRSRYQVWHYFYPTTFPYLHSAAELQDNLDELRAYFDPNHSSLAFRHMVIVAHSMGGLLARRLVTESRDTLWTNAFTRPLVQLNCTPTERATLRHYFFFHPEPGIERVIFLATPHRGSDLAASWEGRVGRTLADHDTEFDDFFGRIARKNADGLTERMRLWSKRHRLTSVQVLSPENPVLRAMAAEPIAAGVHVHNIVGNQGKNRGENSSDGVVSYRSAHLTEAESELVVPCGHAVNRHPLAVAEILRILRAHARDGESKTNAAVSD